MDYQKAMLEELMSQYVDVDNKDFWDDSICKHYLVAFCPSQLFTNTKSDLGACDKIHNDRLKEKYQKSDKSKYPYENEFYDYLNKLISDLARKIRQGQGRLIVQLDDKAAKQREEEREEKMVLLDVKIKELLQKVEEAGEEGRVQEAADMQNEVDKLQEELKQFKENADAKAEKRMEVCDVCGAFLVTNDSSDRLEAHYQGKQHQGYLKIRDTIDQMRQNRNSGRDHHYNNRDNRDNYSRQRYDYNNDYRRDGGRHNNSGGRGGDYNRRRDGGGGYNDHHHRSSRNSYDNRNRRDSRDRNNNNNANNNGDDDFAGDIERYSRRSRYNNNDHRSRSPIDRRSRY